LKTRKPEFFGVKKNRINFAVMKSKSEISSKKGDWKVPESVIDHYEPFRNKNHNTKVVKLPKTKFVIDDKYEIIDSVGQGAYAVVVAARNKLTDDVVAIKKIENVFEHKLFARRTLRELKICRLLRHDNIMGIRTIMLPKSREEFEDIYIVSDLMQTDLASIIKAPQPFSDDHIQLFTYQILRGLKYIHSKGI
jgi:serine/threonine protein kinase